MTGTTTRPPESETLDRACIARLRADGNPHDVIAELFRRHGPVTFGFFARRAGDRDVAAELNQDLWLAVAAALPRFRGDSSFRTWLFRMAHNELSNLRRRWRTHLDERAEEPPEGFWDGLRDAGGEDPGDALDKERLRTALLRCLAALPENERAVVQGQYYEGVTLAELTSRLGLANASGARALLIAAQRRLRRCLERRGAEER